MNEDVFNQTISRDDSFYDQNNNANLSDTFNLLGQDEKQSDINTAQQELKTSNNLLTEFKSLEFTLKKLKYSSKENPSQNLILEELKKKSISIVQELLSDNKNYDSIVLGKDSNQNLDFSEIRKYLVDVETPEHSKKFLNLISKIHDMTKK